MKKINPVLKKILQDFSQSYQFKRQSVLRGYDFEELRTALAELKDKALDHNENLLARFEHKARAHGSIVWRARDGAEANDLILRSAATTALKKWSKASPWSARRPA